MKQILSIITSFLVLIISPASAQDYEAKILERLQVCYENASSPGERYDCFGSTVQLCLAPTALGLSPSIPACAEAEASAWENIRKNEYDLTVQFIEASNSSLNPCEPDVVTCLQQLSQMIKAADEAAKIKCIEESAEPNAAGEPIMAKSLCRMREAARNTIRLRQLRDSFE